MRSDEYLRLRAACLAMARQSKLADVRERWLMMAASSFVSAAEDAPGTQKGSFCRRSDKQSWMNKKGKGAAV